VDGLAKLFPAERPFRLDVCCVPPDLPVLVLAPHPDDFDAIGVTMRHLAATGHPLHVAVLSSASGVEGTYGGAGRLTPAGMSRIRQEEQRRSCAFFGLPAERLRFPDFEQDAAWQPVVSAGNAACVTEILSRSGAGLVFLPHGQDSNAGHQAVYALFRQVARSCRRPVAALYTKDPKTVAMRIDAYVPFAAQDAEWKATLLRFHDSQQQRNLNTRGHGFDTRILKVNQAIAADLRIADPYAEAFEMENFSQEER
jgi:LmbE family N-acetylglucosaminyl deacetylase